MIPYRTAARLRHRLFYLTSTKIPPGHATLHAVLGTGPGLRELAVALRDRVRVTV
jgi:hypothetical protein